MQKNNNKLILDKIKHTFESIREELNKSKGHAPKPKGEVSAKKKDKGRVIHDSVLRDVELTEKKKKKKKSCKSIRFSSWCKKDSKRSNYFLWKTIRCKKGYSKEKETYCCTKC
jgi:hypothetical protein